MSIPQITQLPPAPQRNDSPADFTEKADAHIASLSQFVTQTNQVVSNINQISPQVADDSALASASAASAAGIANYKGLWSSLTGALNVPASVKHNGSFYFLLNNLTNAALSEPSVTSDWQLIINAGNIRKSLLDSPLCRLFLPNKIVDTLAGALTSTRASTATYVDRYGVVKTAANDEMREESEGWLLEGASTNLLTYSDDFTNAAWSKTEVTITGVSDLGPDNATTVQKITPSTNNTAHSVQRIFSNAITSYSGSVYAKANGYNFLSVRISGGAAGLNASTEVNLSNGDVTIGGVLDVTPMFNGWYRIKTTDTATAEALPTLAFNVRATSGVDSFAGDGSSGVLIYGAQLEQLPFASSYIPTTTAPATRARDIVSAKINNNFVSANQGDWSCAVNVKTFGVDASRTRAIFSHKSVEYAFLLGYTQAGMSDFNFSNRALVAYSDNIETSLSYVKDGTTATSYANGMGGTPITHSPTSDFDFLQDVYFGSNSVGNFGLYGHLKDFRIYDFALNADEVAFLAGVK